jgi:Zn-dependent alcohol dehydrogenase
MRSKFSNQSLRRGCGPLGLFIMALAKSYGAKKIIAFDVEQSRVDFAVKHYASVGVVCPKDTTDDPFTFCKEFVTSKLQEIGDHQGVDVAIEVTGVESALLMAMYSLRSGGTCEHANQKRPCCANTSIFCSYPSRAFLDTPAGAHVSRDCETTSSDW